MMAGGEVIQSLKQNLADLTYMLFTMRNEYELMAQNSDNEELKALMLETETGLREANGSVIKFYYEIDAHEERIASDLYNDEECIKTLQKEVDYLNQSIRALVEGNQNFLDSIKK